MSKKRTLEKLLNLEAIQKEDRFVWIDYTNTNAPSIQIIVTILTHILKRPLKRKHQKVGYDTIISCYFTTTDGEFNLNSVGPIVSKIMRRHGPTGEREVIANDYLKTLLLKYPIEI